METPAEFGTLYVVATPIGNLEDITLRALRVLREVGVIAAEDTRHTRKLLSHYDIHTPMISCHEYSDAAQRGRLVRRLMAGEDVAVVTDAGTPGVSDPGSALIRDVVEAGANVCPVPGPSAVLAALTGCGLPMDRFRFAGFLPRRGPERREALAALARERETTVIYEAPHRLVKTLRELADALGARPACLARELTKIHEEFIRAPLTDLAGMVAEPVKGECAIVLGGAEAPQADAEPAGDWRAALHERIAAGASRRDAARSVAEEFGVGRKEAYAAAAEAKSDER